MFLPRKSETSLSLRTNSAGTGDHWSHTDEIHDDSTSDFVILRLKYGFSLIDCLVGGFNPPEKY